MTHTTTTGKQKVGERDAHLFNYVRDKETQRGEFYQSYERGPADKPIVDSIIAGNAPRRVTDQI